MSQTFNAQYNRSPYPWEVHKKTQETGPKLGSFINNSYTVWRTLKEFYSVLPADMPIPNVMEINNNQLGNNKSPRPKRKFFWEKSNQHWTAPKTNLSNYRKYKDKALTASCFQFQINIIHHKERVRKIEEWDRALNLRHLKDLSFHLVFSIAFIVTSIARRIDDDTGNI